MAYSKDFTWMSKATYMRGDYLKIGVMAKRDLHSPGKKKRGNDFNQNTWIRFYTGAVVVNANLHVHTRRPVTGNMKYSGANIWRWIVTCCRIRWIVTGYRLKESEIGVRILIGSRKKNSVAFSPQANYTDRETANYSRNLVPTSADRAVSVVGAADPVRSLISIF
jgi:hypothetical protein